MIQGVGEEKEIIQGVAEEKEMIQVTKSSKAALSKHCDNISPSICLSH